VIKKYKKSALVFFFKIKFSFTASVTIIKINLEPTDDETSTSQLNL